MTGLLLLTQDEVAEPEPAPPAAADDEKPPQARKKRARLGSKAGYELEKLRATKEVRTVIVPRCRCSLDHELAFCFRARRHRRL